MSIDDGIHVEVGRNRQRVGGEELQMVIIGRREKRRRVKRIEAEMGDAELVFRVGPREPEYGNEKVRRRTYFDKAPAGWNVCFVSLEASSRFHSLMDESAPPDTRLR